MSVLAVAAAGAVMAGAALQSAVGFGFALVAAPLLYAAAPSPEQAVGLMIVLGLEVNLLTLLAERRRPDPVWRDVVPSSRGRSRGALAGVASCARSTRLTLQLLVTAGVLVALAVNLRARPSRAGAGTVACGAAAGRPVVGRAETSTSTGGPRRALMMARGLRPEAVRDTLTTSFVGFAALSPWWRIALTVTSGAVPGARAGRRARPAHRRRPLAGRPRSRASPPRAPTSAC